MTHCMGPNDQLADLEHQKAIEALKAGDAANAAWHETAAAHLTTPARRGDRGRRAFRACYWWVELAGRPDWGRQMAQAFVHDPCIPASDRALLRKIARGQEVTVDDMHGVGLGDTALNVISWGIVALSAIGAWKLGHYVITGRWNSGGSGKLPPAWRAAG